MALDSPQQYTMQSWYEQLRRAEKLGLPSQTTQEADKLRKEVQHLQADLAGMLAADAGRHEADRVAEQRRAAFSDCVVMLFTAFETSMRDFTTVLAAMPAAHDAFRHPAAASFYAQLATINAAVTQLRFDLQRRP